MSITCIHLIATPRDQTPLNLLTLLRIGLSELRRELVTHAHTSFALLADTPLYVSIFIWIMKLRGLIVFFCRKNELLKLFCSFLKWNNRTCEKCSQYIFVLCILNMLYHVRMYLIHNISLSHMSTKQSKLSLKNIYKGVRKSASV